MLETIPPEDRPLVGSEAELGLMIQHHEDSRYTPSGTGLVHNIKKYTDARRSPEFYRPGSRFTQDGYNYAYVDIGEHPEVGTIPHGSLLVAAARERRAAKWVCALFDSMVEGGDIHKYLLQWRAAGHNTEPDSSGKGVVPATWGYHRNFLARRPQHDGSLAGEKEVERKKAHIRNILTVHFATRPIYNGAGGLVTVDRNGTLKHTVGHKLASVEDAISFATTRKKPIYNTRDEPLCDGEKWMRIHDVSGDPNMSYLAVFLGFGTTRLLIDAGQLGLEIPQYIHFKNADMVAAARTVAFDTTCRQPLRNAQGKTITALEVQEVLRDMALQASHRVPLSHEDHLALSEWGNVLDLLKVGGPEAVADVVDWVARREKIESAPPEKQVSADLTWDIMNRGGYGNRLRQAQEKADPAHAWVPTAEHENAPLNGMAVPRQKFLDLVAEFPHLITSEYQVSWETLSLPQAVLRKQFTLRDPYDSHPPKFDDYLAEARYALENYKPDPNNPVLY